MPNYSGVWSLPAVYQAVAQGNWPYSPTNGLLGLFGGGNDSSRTNVISKINIVATGNSTDFGDLLAATDALAACSSDVRGVFGGGYSGAYLNVIQYVTFSTSGNSSDFGHCSLNSPGPSGV